MAKEPEKVRTGFYIEKEVLDRCDELLTQANVKSRNEFVTEALRFYCGYLTSKQNENYLLQSLSSVLISTIRDTENRLARMDFKIATELSKLSHVVAHTHAIDEQALSSLHLKCVEEVKRINGAVDFEDAYNYQSGGSKIHDFFVSFGYGLRRIIRLWCVAKGDENAQWKKVKSLKWQSVN